jgi:hypothetical protein
MKTLDDLFYEVEDLCARFFKDWKEADAAALGLDPRAHYGTLYYSRDGIAVDGNTRSLDYYGGFEYVKGDDRKEIGPWTVYLSSSKRIRGHLQRVLDPEEARDLLEEYDEWEECGDHE